MPYIDSTDDLIEFLACSIPEKRADFDSLVARLGIRFVLDESTDAKVFRASSTEKKITVGQKGMERLWAHAFAYSAAFLETAWKLQNRDVPLDAEGQAILDEASQLLTWSVRADMALKEGKAAQISDTPTGLPSPFDYSEDGTVLSVAQSLWCHSLCFILFHEISHIQLGHRRQAGEVNVEQEKDADREAARWLLDEGRGSERRQLERNCGVATALLYLAVTDVYLPGYHGSDYPPGYDRLFQTLSQYFFDPESEDSERVWSFVAISLILHIRNKQIPLDEHGISGSWRQIADAIVNVLANQEAS